MQNVSFFITTIKCYIAWTWITF